jgi:hypothetical protein
MGKQSSDGDELMDLLPDTNGFLRSPVLTENGDGYMIAHTTTKTKRQWFQGRALCGEVSFALVCAFGEWELSGEINHKCDNEEDCSLWDFLEDLGFYQGNQLQ